MKAPKILCIGGSSGAIETVRLILADLPKTLSVPVVIALHRHKHSRDVLLRLLHAKNLPAIIEPNDKDQLSIGATYLAPPNYHLMVDKTTLCLSVDEPVRHARPSIDVLFHSVAEAFGSHAVCILLSGANEDGVSGAAHIAKRGGLVLVQDPQTAPCPAMPQAAIARVAAAHVHPVDGFGPALAQLFAPARAAQ